MPFTVEDFEDLLRLLYERPEWQERLRRVILPPELFELPRIAQELADANRAERERLARLEVEQQATRQALRDGFAQTGERLDRVEGRLGNVEGRLGNVETELAAFRTENVERFDRMDQRFDRTDTQMLRMSGDLGTLKGTDMERRYREHASWFGHLIEQPVALTPAEVSTLLGREVAAGRLLPGDARRVDRADVILRSDEPGPPRFLVVEVSWLVQERDVRRALDRALLLRKAGHRADAAVAGEQIQEDARALAERLGVGRLIEEELDAEELTAGASGEP
jgi:hypothetical protein